MKGSVFWQPIMGTMNLLSYKSENLFSDPRCAGHHGNVELPGGIVFLTQFMGICCHQATKDSFLITQTLITCCQRLAGQNTCSFAEIIHKLNLYWQWILDCMTACMRPWCNFLLLWGGGQIGKQTHKKNSQNKLD